MNKLLKSFISLTLGLLLVLGVAYLLQIDPTQAAAATDQSAVIQAGLTYLQTQQQPDGGILGFSGVSDPDTTARSVMAFITARKPLSDAVSVEGKTMLDYLATQAITFTHDTTGTLFPGRAGILLSAVALTGKDVASFGGMDLAGELDASFHPDTGAYSTTATQGYSSGAASDQGQAWAILGLSLAGKSVPEPAIRYLTQSQTMDGSWGMDDPDTTALAMTALLASRKVDAQNAAVQNALEFFHDTQLASAGWRPSWDTDPLNADSTGWALQALVSAGEDLRGQSWMKDQTNPVDALLNLQKPDGSLGGTYANPYSTAEAVIGLAGIPLSNLGIAPVSHRAGLVIFYGGDSLFTTCISFTDGSITGLNLLERASLPVQTATNPNQGTAVCKIGDVGEQADNCFGSMPNYWSYWQLGANGWEYSVTGADQSQVVDGSVNAWSWGTGNPPPTLSFQNLCEGVAYIQLTAVQTALPSTSTPKPSPVPTLTHATLPPQSTSAATGSQNIPGSYILYGSIIVVLALLIIYLIRSRSK